MPDNANSIFDTDFVYMSGGTQEFKNANISMKVDADKVSVTLTCSELVDNNAIEQLLSSLLTSNLNRIRIDLHHDCQITLVVGDQHFNVELYENEHKVKSLSPIA